MSWGAESGVVHGHALLEQLSCEMEQALVAASGALEGSHVDILGSSQISQDLPNWALEGWVRPNLNQNGPVREVLQCGAKRRVEKDRTFHVLAPVRCAQAAGAAESLARNTREEGDRGTAAMNERRQVLFV